jgi:uncharacterized protein GlcG (DUF336 family)
MKHDTAIRLSLCAVLGTTAALSASGAAPALHQMPSLSAALALEAASAAQESCLKAGARVSVSVVDAEGVVLVMLREDGAAPHTVSTSERKAYTALSSRMPTSQLVKIVTANPDAHGMGMIEGFLPLTGGVPIRAGEAVVGAIGVSGSPGPDGDEKCAAAGISSITPKLAP